MSTSYIFQSTEASLTTKTNQTQRVSTYSSLPKYRKNKPHWAVNVFVCPKGFTFLQNWWWCTLGARFKLRIEQLLKPNGTLIVAVPNYKSFDANHYGKFWAAYDVPRHLWHFSQKSIQMLFSKVNMNLVRTLPMKFDSFYVSLLSEKYKTGSSNFISAMMIGLRSNFKARRSKEYSSLIYILKKA